MIRFCLHPGPVISVNDSDEHFISAAKLAALYGVRMSECVVYDPRLPGGGVAGFDTSVLLHLYPSTQGAAYWKISEVERAQYPLEKQLPNRGVIVRSGERKMGVFRATFEEIRDLLRSKSS